MIGFDELKNNVEDVIKVMKNTGYINFKYKGKSNEKIKKDILNSKNTYLVCFEKKKFKSKKIIGYFIFGPVNGYLKEANIKINKNYAYHLGIGIHSDYRRKKLGKRLTEYGLEKIKKEFKGIYADVGSDNISSLKLQESCGFKKIDEYKSNKRDKKTKNILFVKEF